jgi:hypothetical protein
MADAEARERRSVAAVFIVEGVWLGTTTTHCHDKQKSVGDHG